ncbi:MAG: hypothetical protein AB7T06_21995 [Kofleriaceae bacterium]
MRIQLIACAMAATACTHTRTLNQVNDLSGGEEVTVELQGYGELDAITVPTTRGMAFRANDGGDFLDPNQITSVEQVRHGRGALEGLLLGGGITGVSMAMLGYASGDDECTGFCLFTMSAEDKAVFGLVLGGITGGLLGVVIGGIRGSHYVYENRESIKITPSGPPGSAAGLTVTF